MPGGKYKYVFPKTRLFVIGCKPPKLDYAVDSTWVADVKGNPGFFENFEYYISDLDDMSTSEFERPKKLEECVYFKKIVK